MQNKKSIIEMILVAIFLYLLTLLIFKTNQYLALQNLTYLSKVAQVIFYLIIILTIFFVAKKVENQKIDSIGLYSNGMAKQLLIGIGLFLILSLLPIVAILLGVKEQVLNPKLPNVISLICYSLIDIFFVGFGEELVFRGFSLEKIKKVTNSTIWTILISSILFGLWHYRGLSSIPLVIMATIIGVFFSACKLKIKKCNIISLALAHGLNDAFPLWLSFFLF